MHGNGVFLRRHLDASGDALHQRGQVGRFVFTGALVLGLLGSGAGIFVGAMLALLDRLDARLPLLTHGALDLP